MLASLKRADEMNSRDVPYMLFSIVERLIAESTIENRLLLVKDFGFDTGRHHPLSNFCQARDICKCGWPIIEVFWRQLIYRTE